MILGRYSTLHIALGASLLVHAALLSVHVVNPQAFNRVFQDAPLEVILVNARSKETVANARAIAQATLAGGGNADAGRATTPLPPSELRDMSDTLETTSARTLERMQVQQNVLLSQIKQQMASLQLPNPQEAKQPAERSEREAKRQQLSKLLAEIERRINSENARPKKRYISPSTREAVYAVYYDKLRRTIEDRGTAHFPTLDGRKLYGELTMIVTINHDGQVLSTEVVSGSGNPDLDRRATAIARSAGPFGAFSAEMRRQADQILVVSRFRFMRDETAQVSVSP